MALSRLLSSRLEEECEDGYLIYQLVVEGMDPAQVAREWSVSRPTLVELLRDAVDELGWAYEDVATSTMTRCRGATHLPGGIEAAAVAIVQHRCAKAAAVVRWRLHHNTPPATG